MAQFTAKDVMRKLKSHDRLFEFRAGHGNSHQVVMYHPSINGKPVSCPLPSHGKRDISHHVLGSIKRAFDLPGNFWQSK
jgi:hypothetical protein